MIRSLAIVSRPHSIDKHETCRTFESYYDAKWVPMHEYFVIHKRRFIESVEFLHEHVEVGAHIGDLVQPGDGPGPLAEFFSMDRNAVLTLITTDLREPLDVPDSTSDLILCTETIEHIKDRDSQKIEDLERFTYSGVDSMLSEISRILRPKGLLFITTPNSSSFENLHKWLMDELPYMAEHVREYTVALLNERCGKQGLIPIKIDVRNSWGNVETNLLAEFERLLASFPVKRPVSRCENIFALYRKNSN